MKQVLKPLSITGIYSLIVFIGCVIAGFFTTDVRAVLPPDTFGIKLLTGQAYFMSLFPAVLTTGFLLGFAMMFGTKRVGTQKAFSHDSFRNFRIVLLYAMAFAILAFCANEVGLISYNHAIENAKIRRRNYNEYIQVTQDHMNDGELSLAAYYLKSAWELYPSSPEVARLDRELEALQASEKIEPVVLYDDGPVYEEVMNTNEGQRDALDYLDSARQAFSEERYIDAHYFATLSAAAAGEGDANWDLARQIAAMAWNMLQVPVDSVTPDGIALFSDKMRGYEALSRGDIIEAYNIYSQLHADYPADAEVARYFSIAREQLESVYFYTDETDDLRTFESSQGVFFSLTNEDGSKSDYYISGITVIKDSSRMIQYLRNLSVINYDQHHNAVSSYTVPYAKMTAEPVKYGRKSRYEPFLTLVSVDRNDSHNRLYPVYSFNRDDTPVPTHLQLPMSYTDFNLICRASSGPDGLAIAQLYVFSQKAEDFGYSGEMFYVPFLHRILFPLEMLILFMMVGLMGFRYRLLPGRVFKFRWIVTFPVFTVILYPLMNILLYFFDSINLVGYNCYNTGFLPIAIVVQLLFLLWCCFLFVSARGE
ncbi:MAG: hypothetical protein MJ178_06295 [Treponemataceae bacterium]|nr:hypothetical protein [Treponemataceae bacterium]